MKSQKSTSSLTTQTETPEVYVLRYVGSKEPVRLTKKTRDRVLESMAKGSRFIQIGPYTVMVNSIVAIEPEW